MRSNIHHEYALLNWLLSDAQNYWYQSGDQLHNAEQFSNAISLCESNCWDVSHQDILHIIDMVNWNMETIIERETESAIYQDAIESEYEHDLIMDDIAIPF